MPKYLWLAHYTEEGTRGLLRDGGSRRRSAVEDAVRTLGGSLEAFYFGFGGTDVYAVVDLPDNVTGAAATLAFNASGRAQVETRVLLTPEEMDEAVRRTSPLRGAGHLLDRADRVSSKPQLVFRKAMPNGVRGEGE